VKTKKELIQKIGLFIKIFKKEKEKTKKEFNEKTEIINKQLKEELVLKNEKIENLKLQLKKEKEEKEKYIKNIFERLDNLYKITYKNLDMYFNENPDNFPQIFDIPKLIFKKELKDKDGKYTGYINENNNNKYGNGIMIYNNGDIYEGNWKNNKKDGIGIYKNKNGEIYLGEYKEDKKNGYGKIIYLSGYVYDGKWKNDNKEFGKINSEKIKREEWNFDIIKNNIIDIKNDISGLWIKTIVLGNVAGKTSIVKRFSDSQFIIKKVPTKGGNYLSFQIILPNYKNEKIYLNFWDTAGQEKYRSLNKLFYLIFNI